MPTQALVEHFQAAVPQLQIQELIQANSPALYIVDFEEGVDHVRCLSSYQHWETLPLWRFFGHLCLPF